MLIGCGFVVIGSRVIGLIVEIGCGAGAMIGSGGGDHWKKNGSIDTRPCVTPSVLSSVFVAQLAPRW